MSVATLRGRLAGRVARPSLAGQQLCAVSSAIPWVPPVGKQLEYRFQERHTPPWTSSRARKGRAPARLRAADSERLSLEIEEVAAEHQASGEFLSRRDVFIRELGRRLEGELTGCRLVPFGSAVNGLWMRDSDLDLSVECPTELDRVAGKRLLKRVGSIIHRLTGDRPEPRMQAKIPILRWEPEQEGVPSCDVSVNNSLAVVNSQLLAAYASADTRVRPLVVALKAWARARGINDRSRGTLSSFALTLMALHLLQRRSVLPSLQELAVLQEAPEREVMGMDCRFLSDSAAIAEAVASVQDQGGASADGLGVLLYAFFRHFGVDYRGGAISVRGGCPAPDAQGGDRPVASGPNFRAIGAPAGRFLLVENPFEPGKDVANVEVGQMARIREEFRKAYRHLGQGRPLEELCNAGSRGEQHPDTEEEEEFPEPELSRPGRFL